MSELCHILYENAREEELGTQIGDDVWEESFSETQSSSFNARHQVIQFKVMHRLNYSKTTYIWIKFDMA